MRRGTAEGEKGRKVMGQFFGQLDAGESDLTNDNAERGWGGMSAIRTFVCRIGENFSHFSSSFCYLHDLGGPVQKTHVNLMLQSETFLPPP